MQKKWLLVAAVPVIALGLAGCGALLTLEASRSIYDQPQGKNDVQKKPFENDEFLVETARRYGLMALFAETAYRGELLEKDRDELSCSYLKPGWSGDGAGIRIDGVCAPSRTSPSTSLRRRFYAGHGLIQLKTFSQPRCSNEPPCSKRSTRR